MILGRPTIQIVSLVLGLILLVDVVIYFLVYKEAYEQQMIGRAEDEMNAHEVQMKEVGGQRVEAVDAARVAPEPE